MKKILLSILSVASLINLSCERAKKNTATLVLQLPQAETVSSKALSPGLSISSLADVNCYAIFVGGPEDFMRVNSCKDTTSGVEKMRFGNTSYAGFIPAGSQISVEVPSGPDRNIYLVGLKAQNNACVSFINQKPDESNISTPHIIGKITMGLAPGEVTVPITTSFDANEKFDDCYFQNGGGGTSGGIASQIMIKKDFFPRQGFLVNSCSQFYIGTYDSNGFPANNNQNLQINISNGTTNYAMYDNCYCTGSPSVLTLPAGQKDKCVSFTSQTTPGIYTFKVEPVVVPTGLTANHQRTFEVRNSTDSLVDFSGPRRILPNTCYRFQFQALLWDSNFTTASIGTLNTPVSGNFYASEATCLSASAPITGSTTSFTGTTSALYKSDVWFKAPSIGKTTLGISVGGITTALDFSISVESTGTSSVAKAEFGSDYNQVPNSQCSRRPLRVQLVNSYGVAVPAPAGGITVTITSTGPAALNIYQEGDSTCGTTATNTFTIAQGNSHADFYYLPTATGNYSLTATVNGVSTVFNLTSQ